MQRDMELELRRSFRTVFPEYARRMEAAVTEEARMEAYHDIIAECRRNAREALGEQVENDKDAMGPILLTPDNYVELFNARTDDIKYGLQKMLNGLEMLKNYTNEPDIAAQLIISGLVTINLEAIEVAYIGLKAGATSFAAALKAVTACKAGILGVAITVVILIIIPILYFMQKPAVCMVGVINELEEPLTFVDDYNVHGKAAVFTRDIPGALMLSATDGYYCMGTYVTTKRDQALYGTQYGMQLKAKKSGQQFFLGVECPLSGLYVDNNCWCGFSGSSEEIAKKTDDENEQDCSISNDKFRVSIRCHSGSGSVAYYIARIGRNAGNKL